MLKRRKQVNFVFDNPGSQITASFNPINRKCHSDYWGKNITNIIYEKIAWPSIKCLYMLMKRREIPFISKDIIKYIRNLLFNLYIQDLIAIGSA